MGEEAGFLYKTSGVMPPRLGMSCDKRGKDKSAEIIQFLTGAERRPCGGSGRAELNDPISGREADMS